MSPLTLTFLRFITADSHVYHLPEIVAGQGPIPSSPILLKLSISQAHVGSHAIVSFIGASLTELDTKMIELDSNIEEFNFYVMSQIEALLSRSETSINLRTNLFKGQKKADNIADLIRRKENVYEEQGHDIN
jgi:hypothetical protein